jgi:NitT/TauT family transport system substrate-binding protein
MYAADKNGYYTAEGLAVTFVEGGANVDSLAPVLDGTAQFGVAGADQLLLARSEGQPVRAIATIYRRSPVAFISLADSGINRPQDFVGKTIRVAPNLVTSLRALTAYVGISPEQYAEVTLPSDFSAFTTGEVPVWGYFVDGLVVSAQQAGVGINIIFCAPHLMAGTILFRIQQRMGNW